MKIAIIGATGNVGTRLVDEALKRHHAVTGLARDPFKTGAAHRPIGEPPETSRSPDAVIPC